MNIELYNTQGRKIERVSPIKADEVGIYTCGPTVYSTAHLGNFRSFIFADTLRRVLEYDGLAVKQIINITDVGHLTSDASEGEDKIEQAARAEHSSAWEIARKYEDQFWADFDRLNLKRPEVAPRATDHIAEQIALVKKLEEKGFTYRTSDGIYFDTAKFPRYHEFSGQDEGKQAGARVEANPEKRNPEDFALWKFSPAADKRQMEWESPWGIGFPGWHLECSAMSVKFLGQPFDIHTGGVDHIGTHHPSEIAQSEAAGDQPLANYWLHGEHMTVEGEKMSKSLGNIITLDDLVERGHDPLSFRLLCLMTHYRKPLNFTWAALAAAETALVKLRTITKSLPKPERRGHLEGGEDSLQVKEELEDQFRSLIGRDLAIPQALALLWDSLKSDLEPQEKSSLVTSWDEVFGLKISDFLGEGIDIPKAVRELANERERYRKSKDYRKADQLRDKIESLGYEIRDTGEKPELLPKVGPTLL